MQRTHLLWAIFIISIIMQIGMFVQAIAEEFKIGVWHDPVTVHYFWNDTTYDSVSAEKIFADMDTLGINFVIGVSVPQMAGLCERNNLWLVPYNPYGEVTGSCEMVTHRPIISGSPPLYLESYISNGCWFHMTPYKDEDSLMGYVFDNTDATGENYSANDYRKATQTLHDDGFLFRKKDWSDSKTEQIGTYHRDVYLHNSYLFGWDTLTVGSDVGLKFNDSLLYQRAFFSVMYEDETCGQNDVIAQMRADLLRSYDNAITIDNDTIVDQDVTLYNDTLLCHENGDTLNISDSRIRWSTWDEIYWNGYTYHRFNAIDTLADDGVSLVRWGYVTDAIKDIHPADLTESEWDTVSVLFHNYTSTAITADSKIEYLLYWYDNSDFYIKDFFVSNKTSLLFNPDMVDVSTSDEWNDSLTSYYNALSTGDISDIIPAWAPYDEAKTGSWWPINHCKRILQGNTETSDMKIMGSITYGYCGHSKKISNIVGKTDMSDAFIQMNDGFYDNCAISPYSYAAQDDTSIQVSIDNAITRLESASEIANSEGLHFIPILYPNGHYDLDNAVCSTKEAFGPDLKLQIYLCVAYGADGIAYYPYTSDGSLPPEDSIPRPFKHERVLATYQGSCPSIDTTEITWRSRGFIIKDAQGDWVRVNGQDSWSKWDEAKKAHWALRNIEDTLIGRTVLGAGRWDNLTGSDFTRISSEKFDSTEVFVQWAEFTGTDAKKYHMLINRRTWPDSTTAPNNKSDSQWVHFATDIAISGDKIAVDILTGDTIVLIDSSGYATGSVFLPPGDAAILRFETSVNYNWHGNVSHIRRCAPGGTHNIVGDITIDAGDMLSIGHDNTYNITANIDSMASGYDPNKVEIIVNGQLSIEGTSTDTVTISTPTSDTAWYGIRCGQSSKLLWDYVNIENAEMGVYKSGDSYDTLRHCLIDGYSMCGLYASGDNIYLDSCMFETQCADSGVWACVFTGVGAGSIENCDFSEIKYGIKCATSNITTNNLRIHDGEPDEDETIFQIINGSPSDTMQTILHLYNMGDLLICNAATNDTVLWIDSAGSYMVDTLDLLPEQELYKSYALYFWMTDFGDLEYFPEGGTHYIGGDIAVASTDTLEINEGNTVLVTPGTADIYVDGLLRISGSPADKVTFTNLSGVNDGWQGIKVRNSGSAILKYTKNSSNNLSRASRHSGSSLAISPSSAASSAVYYQCKG